jgi:F0F1-type ATP synthase epsilon subunit
MNTFSCKLVTPEKVSFEGSVWQVSTKAGMSNFALRARHANLLFTSEKGTIEIALTPENRQKWKVSDFIVEFAANHCSIMCQEAQLIQ